MVRVGDDGPLGPLPQKALYSKSDLIAPLQAGRGLPRRPRGSSCSGGWRKALGTVQRDLATTRCDLADLSQLVGHLGHGLGLLTQWLEQLSCEFELRGDGPASRLRPCLDAAGALEDRGEEKEPGRCEGATSTGEEMFSKCSTLPRGPPEQQSSRTECSAASESEASTSTVVAGREGPLPAPQSTSAWATGEWLAGWAQRPSQLGIDELEARIEQLEAQLKRKATAAPEDPVTAPPSVHAAVRDCAAGAALDPVLAGLRRALMEQSTAHAPTPPPSCPSSPSCATPQPRRRCRPSVELGSPATPERPTPPRRSLLTGQAGAEPAALAAKESRPWCTLPQ